MKQTFLLLAFLSSFSAFGATKNSYSCDVVPSFDDWTVTVDLTTGEADFFDNDSHVILKVAKVGVIEVLPPVLQRIYELNEDGKKTSFTFETTMQGAFLKATLRSKDAYNNAYKYDFECR